LLDQAADLASFGSMDVEVVNAVFSESVGTLGESFWALVGGDDAKAGMVGDGGPELDWDSAAPLVVMRSWWKAPIFCSFK
jgi:hypothetical protein